MIYWYGSETGGMNSVAGLPEHVSKKPGSEILGGFAYLRDSVPIEYTAGFHMSVSSSKASMK